MQYRISIKDRFGPDPSIFELGRRVRTRKRKDGVSPWKQSVAPKVGTGELGKASLLSATRKKGCGFGC